MDFNIIYIVQFLSYQLLQLLDHCIQQYFLGITVITSCILLRFIPPNNYTRLIVKGIFLILIFSYLIYLSLHIPILKNLSDLVNYIFSLLFYLGEVFILLYISFYSLLSIWSTGSSRSIEADRYSQSIISGQYLPSVDVFIPTYNEPEFIVRRTVVGCQAINYPNKKIYILDDMHRPQFRDLAKELKCEYITRHNNEHAKAGNLNNALLKTHGELIAVLDADFVPFKTFLIRTVGFFQQPKVALVQTSPSFYNPDFYARSLGVDCLLPSDMAFTYEFDLTTKDAAKCSNCCGTSYVIRRAALKSVSNYETITIQEDSSTSTKMLLLGFKTIFLREILSIGEAPRTYRDLIIQRTRWLHGDYQIFSREYSLPIWSKFNLLQKAHYFSWFISIYKPFFRLFVSIIPLLYFCLNLVYINVFIPKEFYYFLTFYIFFIVSNTWNVEYTVSCLQNDLYQTLLLFPFLKSLFFTIRNPFSLPFKVTPKSVTNQNKKYNFNYTWPLIVGIFLSIIIICLYFWKAYIGEIDVSPDSGVFIFLLAYQVLLMTIAVFGAIEQPERRITERFPLCTPCKLQVSNLLDNEGLSSKDYYGYTTNCSERGAKIILKTQAFFHINESISVNFLDYNFSLRAEVIRNSIKSNHAEIVLKFCRIEIQEYRKLVEMLYMNRFWYSQKKRPKNIEVFIALLLSLIGFKSLIKKF